MPDEKQVRITEAYNPKPLTQAVNQVVERGYNGLPLAQAVNQLNQSPNSTPSGGSNPSSNPSTPTGPTPANNSGGKS